MINQHSHSEVEEPDEGVDEGVALRVGHLARAEAGDPREVLADCEVGEEVVVRLADVAHALGKAGERAVGAVDGQLASGLARGDASGDGVQEGLQLRANGSVKVLRRNSCTAARQRFDTNENLTDLPHPAGPMTRETLPGLNSPLAESTTMPRAERITRHLRPLRADPERLPRHGSALRGG